VNFDVLSGSGNVYFFAGVITAGISVPVQIPNHSSDLGSNYWPRIQWSSLFGLPSQLLHHTGLGSPGLGGSGSESNDVRGADDHDQTPPLCASSGAANFYHHPHQLTHHHLHQSHHLSAAQQQQPTQQQQQQPQQLHDPQMQNNEGLCPNLDLSRYHRLVTAQHQQALPLNRTSTPTTSDSSCILDDNCLEERSRDEGTIRNEIGTK
jgi:hypothetical protein